MCVVHVDSDSQFQQQINGPGSGKLIICDFFADWCGPCRFIAPVFDQLSSRYPAALFLKINVDTCRATCMTYGIRAMPTFLALFNQREVGRIQGADANSLERMIVDNISLSQAATSASVKSENAANAQERLWLEQIVAQTNQVKQYEDEINQTLAVSIIPLEELKNKSTKENKLNQYMLAKNLLQWFKESFFKWVDKPSCELCNAPSQQVGAGQCNPDEQADGASRVELYNCSSCNYEIRFPRYNNPAKLLETRQGRCGEWANCFALCCRAAGLETRWVNDGLDHVWVEIWSDDLDRWVHCDPCENVIDTPLMYDKGWGKKHAYVLAYSIDHVRDVTWRYSYNHAAAMKRRTSCREPVLRNFLTKLNNRLSKDLPTERKVHLTKIFMKELVEFLSPKNQLRDGSEAENCGRKSGAEEWRKERGELNEPIAKFVPTTIVPTEKEVKAKCLILQYNVVKNQYTRPNDDNSAVIGWDKLAFEAKNVFRKVENDWKKTYICRKDGSTASGELTWKIDLSAVKQVTKVEVDIGKLESFNNGKIRASACCGDSCMLIPNETGLASLENDGPAEYLEITVEFPQKEADTWQNAQLFRSEVNEPVENMHDSQPKAYQAGPATSYSELSDLASQFQTYGAQWFRKRSATAQISSFNDFATMVEVLLRSPPLRKNVEPYRFCKGNQKPVNTVLTVQVVGTGLR
uniref:Peptide-N(4)-(N-acetyl-beta-glucosaminyl)asparagine amidase n=1 Tax=Ditylenchus dipsaci TaxID=166011 RepID=A0A915D0B2_9BILA